MPQAWIIWLIIAAIFIAAEVLTPGFFLLWFGVGALVAAVMAALSVGSFAAQMLIFLMVSVALVIASRTIFEKFFTRRLDPNRLISGVETMIGQVGTVVEPSHGARNEGAVRVYGSVWTAFPEEGERPLKEGDSVAVERIEGNAIYVRRAPHHPRSFTETAEVHEEDIMEFLIPLAVIAVVALYVASKTIRIVPQATVLLIERLGRFNRVAASGLNVITPFLDRPRGFNWTNNRPGISLIDLREQFTDLLPQPVITRDNVTIMVDSVIFWQVTDPVKAVYEVNDLIGGIIQLTITAMRNVIGELDLDHALSSRDTINTKLRVVLDDATHKWGVKVTRVELKNINPPEDVRITMEKQMTAERNRRAVVLQADGEKQAAITRAEGEKQAAITRAEGEKQAAILGAEGQAQARLTAAEAEAESIRHIAVGITAGQGNPAQYLIMMKYIESLREMARSGNSKVIFMPVETSSVLSSIGAFREVFGDPGGQGEAIVPQRQPVVR